MPRYRSILERFDEIVSKYPDRCAVEGDRRRLSYLELDRASRRLAQRMAESGAEPGGFVPLLVRRSPEFVVTVLATLRCGAAYAPIDPLSPAKRREVMIDALGAMVCLADGSVEPPSGLKVIDPGSIFEEDESGGDQDDLPDRGAALDDPVYVIYTSGTTGTPKGVVVPQRGVLRLVVDADYARFDADQRWALASTVAFDASTLEMWAPLLHGGCCVVQERPMPTFDQLGRLIEVRSITDAWMTTALFNSMTEDHCRSLRGLKQLLIGGERVSPPHIRRFMKACPDVRLINGYGPTENTTFSLCHTISAADAEGADIPIGLPIHGSTARIVAPGGEPDEPEQALDAGELLVGGEGLALGYLGRDDLTAQRFVTDREGVRWYRTGDTVVRREDGLIVYTGRLDRQVKIRGYRVELDDIESIMGSCPGVNGCAVVLEGQTSTSQRIVAAYQASGDLSVEQLREYMSQYLPPAHMPQRFTRLDSMPRGMAGKIDRAQVSKLLEAMADGITGVTAGDVGDDSVCTVRVADLVRARLGLDEARALSGGTDLSAIGGYSLLAMRLAADIEHSFGVWLEPVEILGLKRIGLIAERIEELLRRRERGEDGDAEEMIAPVGEDTIGATRQRIFLEHERDPTSRSMLVHQAWVLDSLEDPESIRRVWREIIARHDALRCGYAIDEHGLRLVRLDPDSAAWFFDEGTTSIERDPQGWSVPNDVSERVGLPMRAGQMPLRVHFWRRARGGCLVAVVYHHAAIDEWSLDLLEGEMIRLLSGEELGAEPGSYQRYIACEEAWRDEEAALDLGARVCETQPSDSELPPSGPQESVMLEVGGEGAEPMALAGALDGLASRHGITPAAAGLALLGEVLRERFGDPGRWILTPFSKRITKDLQRLVGCCLDMRLIDASGAADESMDCFRRVGLQFTAAQGKATLALDTLREFVRGRCPEALDHLTRFGFTYREFSADEVRRPGLTVHRVSLPQLAARFGLALHIERRSEGVRLWFEASREFFSDDELGELASAYASRLRGSDGGGASYSHRLLDQRDSMVRVGGDAHATDGSERPTDSRPELLRAMWKELLGSEPQPESRFDEAGGDSLVAMKLSGMIHARMGRKLHVGEFLRHKTFDSLVRWVRDDPEEPYSDFRRPGGLGSGELVVAIPGASGRAVDLHGLWEGCLERGLDFGRMLGFDLVTFVRSMPRDRKMPDRTVERICEITQSERENNPVTLVGYSMGGLLAIAAAARLADEGVPVSEIILLDAYAPAYLSRTPSYYSARLNAEVRRRIRREPVPATTVRVGQQASRNPADTALWKEVLDLYSTWKPPRTDAPCLLIRSASGCRRVRPLLHPETNGLGPLLGGKTVIDTIDVDHLGMLKGGVEAVCDSIAANRRSVPGSGAR